MRTIKGFNLDYDYQVKLGNACQFGLKLMQDSQKDRLLGWVLMPDSRGLISWTYKKLNSLSFEN